jgi:hypothetical protein
MKFQRWMSITVLCIFATLAMTVQANAQQIIKFDPPNSGKGANQGTTSTGINFFGTITGFVTDNNNGTHGFVGTPHGGFNNFDAPGADPVVGCTCPVGINDLGVVGGYYIDANSVAHGFVRSPDGNINTFDDPLAGKAANQGTVPQGITVFEVVAGYYYDTNSVAHGFVRTPDGTLTTFDPSGSIGTFPGNINNFGVIAGNYYDANFVLHGFVRTPYGTITTFDAPGAVGGSIGTYTAFINDLGVIAGSYYDAQTNVETGYVRYPDGHFTKFEAPRSGTVAFAGTNVIAVNLEGAITGDTADDNFDAFAFVRAPNGETTTFAIPGQIENAGNFEGSAGWAINAQGQIAGRWRDLNLALHGFLRLPNSRHSAEILP